MLKVLQSSRELFEKASKCSSTKISLSFDVNLSSFCATQLCLAAFKKVTQLSSKGLRSKRKRGSSFWQGLVRLLASNPADKEVLKATAHALKFMSAERPTYETLQRSGARWFRVFGRQGSDLLLEVAGLQIPPLVVSAVVTGFCTAVIVALVSIYIPSLMSGGVEHGALS